MRHWLILLAVAAFAGTPASTVIRVPVFLASEHDLKTSDFQARLDRGVKAKVVDVLTAKDDMMLLIVSDLVGDLSLVQPSKQALMHEVQQLLPKVHVGLMQAQEGMQVVLDPTPDRDAFARSLTSLPIGGKAGLLDTIVTVTKLADAVAAKSGVRVAVVYVTDSDVRNYREDFANPVINSSDSRDLSRRFPEGLVRERMSRTEAVLATTQTPVFIVQVAYLNDRLNQAYQNGLRQLAVATGGTASFCRSSAEISDAIATTLRQAAWQYRVSVELPQQSPKVVNLVLSSGDLWLGYRSRYVRR